MDRPAKPPGAHWPAQPDALGGLDLLGGGTWLAVSRGGLVAAVLDRVGSLGPAPGKRSRGELPLMAVQHATAKDAAQVLSELDGRVYRGFNLIVGDHRGAWWLQGCGDRSLQAREFEPGIHMMTGHDPDDETSSRVARHLPRFRRANVPAPPDWSNWQTLLQDQCPPREAAINIPVLSGFGTTSSALVAIRASGQSEFLYADGPPHQRPYAPVAWTMD